LDAHQAAYLTRPAYSSLAGTVPIPRWTAIYQTLLELALALRYLHSLALVHRDLKPQNVLLKTSAISDVRNFNCKLRSVTMLAVDSGQGSGLSIRTLIKQPSVVVWPDGIVRCKGLKTHYLTHWLCMQ
jgi:hypothetical protein